MVGWHWAILVAATLLGVVSLTADLVGVGAFPGFGWKQAVGTAVAVTLVLRSAWRIFRESRRDRR
jgi:cytochrome b561